MEDALSSAMDQFLTEDLKCAICLYPPTNAMSLDCNHTYCQLCLSTALRITPSCPICKAPAPKRTARSNDTIRYIVQQIEQYQSSSTIVPEKKTIIKNVQVESVQLQDKNDVSPMIIRRKRRRPAKPVMLLGSSGLSNTGKRKISMLSKKAFLLHEYNCSVEDAAVTEVTHMIVECLYIHEGRAYYSTKTSIKLLQAFLWGCWILPLEWIEACTNAKRILPEEDFEVAAIYKKYQLSPKVYNHGPSRARLLLQPLLSSIEVRLQGIFGGKSPSREEIEKLVRTGGGTVSTGVRRNRNTEPALFVEPEGPTISLEWLLDSIFAATLLSYKKYLLS